MTGGRESPHDLTLDLVEALDSVRFAAGGDPELPMLSGVLVDVDALRAAVDRAPRVVRAYQGVEHELAVLTLGAGGGIEVVGAREWQAGQDGHVAVNREFLPQALSAGGTGQLVLELDGPIRPLAIRRPADERAYSLLMPVKP